MSCDEPQQIDLDLHPGPGNWCSPQYRQFIKRMFLLMNEEAGDEQLVTELCNYAKFNDFPLVGAFVKHAMQIDLGDVHSDLKGIPPLRILTCFGKAFRGDEVGHIGRDILIPLLGHELAEVRGTAVDVLERWLEYDDDGMWLEMMSDHLERERSPAIKRKCESLVEQYEEESPDDMLLEMMNDCPECNEGRLLTMMEDQWECDNCGHEWDYNPLEHEYVQEEEEFDEEDDPVELKEFLTIHRGAANNLRAVVETKKLPLLLAGVLDLHPHLTLDLIESLNIGHLSVRSTSLGLCLHPLRSDAGHLLRAWDVRERFCFSIEPTATDDRWLVFMRY